MSSPHLRLTMKSLALLRVSLLSLSLSHPHFHSRSQRDVLAEYYEKEYILPALYMCVRVCVCE